MPKTKVISNPYIHETSFESWDGEWRPIDESTYPKSYLLRAEYTGGFFPFKVGEIVGILLKEFGNAEEPLEIVFEGPDDEWMDLKEACAAFEPEGCVEAVRGTRALSNARDILPLLRDNFEGVRPIIESKISESAEAQALLHKYLDASGDIVPVCIIGNLSSGKSSFINALIGVELLPSGDRPVTARVYQVQCAAPEEKAGLRFQYGEEWVTLSLDGPSIAIAPDSLREAIIRNFGIIEQLNEDASITEEARLQALIEAINSRPASAEPHVSALVEVNAHFGDGASWMAEKKLIVFDTPGSNSHSNVEHYRVLTDAMRDMSNGLPIYVSQYGSLDSNDNASLYNDITQIKALDKRFAMLVVNKADDADISYDSLSHASESWIKDTVLVQEMDAQGIYFLSSIVGLGSKTGGKFRDHHYGRMFQRLKGEYSGEDPDYSMRLYDFNILPGQLRNRMIEEAAQCPDAMLANSGLYSIARGIMDFAEDYSAYDKCSQARALFDEVVKYANSALDAEEKSFGEWRERERLNLMGRKEALLSDLRSTMRNLRAKAHEAYEPKMELEMRERTESSAVTSEMLQMWEYEHGDEARREDGVYDKGQEAVHAWDNMRKGFYNRVSSAMEARDFLGLPFSFAALAKDFAAAKNARDVFDKALAESDKKASKELFDHVSEHFAKESGRVLKGLEEASKSFWEVQSNLAREQLLELVTSGDSIDAKGQEALKSIIVDFRPISFEPIPEHVLIEYRLPFNPNKLWKAPIAMQYGFELSKRVSRWRLAAGQVHREGFDSWIVDLTKRLEEGVMDLNPELRRLFETLTSLDRHISDIHMRRERLYAAEERIGELIAWKNVEL